MLLSFSHTGFLDVKDSLSESTVMLRLSEVLMRIHVSVSLSCQLFN